MPQNVRVTVLVEQLVGVVATIVDVAVVVSVVQSHAVYAPVCQILIARFSVAAAAVTSHLLLDVASFRNPQEEHCSDPNELVAYAVISTIIVFRYASAATQSA